MRVFQTSCHSSSPREAQRKIQNSKRLQAAALAGEGPQQQLEAFRGTTGFTYKAAETTEEQVSVVFVSSVCRASDHASFFPRGVVAADPAPSQAAIEPTEETEATEDLSVFSVGSCGSDSPSGFHLPKLFLGCPLRASRVPIWGKIGPKELSMGVAFPAVRGVLPRPS
jgi:hypothetical protein